jgi:hypothetical protein
MKLEEKIEELLYEKADDFKISKVIKEYIRNYLSSLDAIFVQNQGKDFLVKHTRTLDGFINTIYNYELSKNKKEKYYQELTQEETKGIENIIIENFKSEMRT